MRKHSGACDCDGSCPSCSGSSAAQRASGLSIVVGDRGSRSSAQNAVGPSRGWAPTINDYLPGSGGAASFLPGPALAIPTLPLTPSIYSSQEVDEQNAGCPPITDFPLALPKMASIFNALKDPIIPAVICSNCSLQSATYAAIANQLREVRGPIASNRVLKACNMSGRVNVTGMFVAGATNVLRKRSLYTLVSPRQAAAGTDNQASIIEFAEFGVTPPLRQTCLPQVNALNFTATPAGLRVLGLLIWASPAAQVKSYASFTIGADALVNVNTEGGQSDSLRLTVAWSSVFGDSLNNDIYLQLFTRDQNAIASALILPAARFQEEFRYLSASWHRATSGADAMPGAPLTITCRYYGGLSSPSFEGNPLTVRATLILESDLGPGSGEASGVPRVCNLSVPFTNLFAETVPEWDRPDPSSEGEVFG